MGSVILLFTLGLAGSCSWWVAEKYRPFAEGSAAFRKFGLFWSLPLMMAGVATAFRLPEQIPFNRESPAGIFTVYLPCFLAGGALFFGAIGIFVASLRARPASID